MRNLSSNEQVAVAGGGEVPGWAPLAVAAPIIISGGGPVTGGMVGGLGAGGAITGIGVGTVALAPLAVASVAAGSIAIGHAIGTSEPVQGAATAVGEWLNEHLGWQGGLLPW